MCVWPLSFAGSSTANLSGHCVCPLLWRLVALVILAWWPLFSRLLRYCTYSLCVSFPRWPARPPCPSYTSASMPPGTTTTFGAFHSTPTPHGRQWPFPTCDRRCRRHGAPCGARCREGALSRKHGRPGRRTSTRHRSEAEGMAGILC